MNFREKDTGWFIGVSFALLAFLMGLFAGFAVSKHNVFIGNFMLFITSASILLVGIGLLLAATETFVAKGTYPDNKFVRFVHKSYQVMTGRSDDDLSSPGQDKDVNSQTYLSPEEIIAKSYVIQQYANTKINVPVEPSNKPIIHEDEEVSENIDATAVDEQFDETAESDETVDAGSAEDNIVRVTREETIIFSNDSFTEKTTNSIGIITEDHEVIVVDNENSEKVDRKPSLYDIIQMGEGGLDPLSGEFKSLLEKALQEFEVKDEFQLRLKGKTYGLGARGVKVVEEDETFISYNKNDVKKMLKKFSTVGTSA